jgi:hypothetical protein
MTGGATRRYRDSVGSSLLLALIVGVGLVVTALAKGADSLTARIALDHGHVRAGGLISGKLILDNTTSKRRVLLRGCVTNGRFEIGLRAVDGYLQGGFFSLVGCNPLQALVAANPGVTVYRFKLGATYTGCLQSAQREPPKDSANWMPLCLKDSRGERDIAPRLPAGDYTAVFLPDGKWHGPKVITATLAVTSAG